MPSVATVARRWIPIAALATALCLLVYLTVQQALRAGLNDPQIQMAEDAVAALERGDAVTQVVPAAKVDADHSLAPFLIIYDSTGHAIAGSGTLHGASPAPPPGVFEFVKANGEERVTWQPKRSARIASVLIRTSAKPAAFVLAGRNMREVEKREMYTMNVAAGALAATLVVTLLLVVIGEASIVDRVR